MNLNTSKIYQIEILNIDAKSKIYKRYKLTLLATISYNNNMEYLEKVKSYLLAPFQVQIIHKEEDNNYYFYVRNKKYLLSEEVTIIWNIIYIGKV